MDELKVFSLDGMEIDATVFSVYDGDTITAVFPFPGTDKLYKWKCRLEGIDTPELRTKNMKEKMNAVEVRDILRKKIDKQEVKLKCGKMDKYGRTLVTVVHDNININEWLIEEGCAVKYDGGTKAKWNF